MMMELLNSIWNLIPVTLAQSLMYALVALGVMVPFRLLGFPDLSSEGAFPLGGLHEKWLCGPPKLRTAPENRLLERF